MVTIVNYFTIKQCKECMYVCMYIPTWYNNHIHDVIVHLRISKFNLSSLRSQNVAIFNLE